VFDKRAAVYNSAPNSLESDRSVIANLLYILRISPVVYRKRVTLLSRLASVHSCLKCFFDRVGTPTLFEYRSILLFVASGLKARGLVLTKATSMLTVNESKV